MLTADALTGMDHWHADEAIEFQIWHCCVSMTYTVLSAVAFVTSLWVIVVTNNLSQLTIVAFLHGKDNMQLTAVENVLNRRMETVNMLYQISLLSMLSGTCIQTIDSVPIHEGVVVLAAMVGAVVHMLRTVKEDSVILLPSQPDPSQRQPPADRGLKQTPNLTAKEASIIQRLWRKKLRNAVMLTKDEKEEQVQAGYLLKTPSTRGPSSMMTGLTKPAEVWKQLAPEPTTRRWYALKAGVLACYKDEAAWRKGEAAAFHVELSEYSAHEATTVGGSVAIGLLPSELLHESFFGGAAATSSSKPSWYLCHEDAPSTRKWLKILQEGIASTATRPVVSGGAVPPNFGAVVSQSLTDVTTGVADLARTVTGRREPPKSKALSQPLLARCCKATSGATSQPTPSQPGDAA